MKKIVIVSGILISFSVVCTEVTIALPEGFCLASERVGKTNCVGAQIITSDENPVIVVSVHGLLVRGRSFTETISHQSIMIPSGLLSDNTGRGATPVKLLFNWSGSSSDKARIKAGKDLAEGLNNIITQLQSEGKDPKILIMAHNDGGNVVAVASNSVIKPIDVAVFLGTPVLRYDQTVTTGNEKNLYLPKHIQKLFLFYSMNDMVQTIGGLQEGAKRRYGPIKGIDLYNVRLLINGQEPLNNDLYRQMIHDNILTLCAEILTRYNKNKNLVANIDTSHEKATNLIAIKPYDTQGGVRISGKPTDTLWPDWEQFTYKPGEIDEKEESDKARFTFNNTYNREFLDTESLVDRTMISAQAAVCTTAVGSLGRTLAYLPPANKNAVAQLCCPVEAFRSKHPQAAKSLSCSDYLHIPTPLKTPELDNNLCVNAIGVAGSGLNLLDAETKKLLKGRCCSQEFSTDHPHAAKALKCII